MASLPSVRPAAGTLLLVVVILWLLVVSGCAPAKAVAPGAALPPPRAIRVCVRPPNVPKHLRTWAVPASGVPLVKGWEVEGARQGGLPIYHFDPNAPPESPGLLPIPHNKLKCPERILAARAILPPKAAVAAALAKEKEKAKAKKSTVKTAVVKKKPSPKVVRVKRVAAAPACEERWEPGQKRRRTGAPTCVRSTLLIHRRDAPEPPQAISEPQPPARRPFDLPKGVEEQYKDWGLQRAPPPTLTERLLECIGKFCHARHPGFQEQEKKKAAGPRDGQVWSKGINGTGGGSKVTTRIKPIRPGGYREKLAKATGKDPKDAEAHHVFPIKHRPFFKGKVDIDNPKYGTWWDKTQHRKKSHEYGQDWKKFFDDNSNPTAEQILKEGRRLAKKYGFSINF